MSRILTFIGARCLGATTSSSRCTAVSRENTPIHSLLQTQDPSTLSFTLLWTEATTTHPNSTSMCPPLRLQPPRRQHQPPRRRARQPGRPRQLKQRHPLLRQLARRLLRQHQHSKSISRYFIRAVSAHGRHARGRSLGESATGPPALLPR
jgi:hypothetical protein